MRKIRVSWTSNDAVNVGGQDVIDMEDDATEAEIEDAVREVALEHFDWWYDEVQDENV